MKCQDCNGTGEIVIVCVESRLDGRRVRNNTPTQRKNICERCRGTGRGRLNPKEMRAAGFRLMDSERGMAEWTEGTMVRHPVTCVVAHVKSFGVKGHVVLESIDGAQHDIFYGEARPRDDWQTVEPLFGADIPGVITELDALSKEIEQHREDSSRLQKRVLAIKKRLVDRK